MSAFDQMVAARNREAALALLCAFPDAGPEPPPLLCCGGTAFLFGHVHLNMGEMRIDDDLTIHNTQPPPINHGRWGPHVHLDNCPHVKKEREVLNSPEPPPKPNDGTPVWMLVVEDMKQRDLDGRAKYGTPLQTFNGRKPLVDAYQEGLDLVVYLRQKIEEERSRHAIFQKIAGSAPCGCSYDDIGSTLLVCFPHSQDMEKFAKEIMMANRASKPELPPIENGVLRAEILILKILRREGGLHPSKLLGRVRMKWAAAHPEQALIETDIVEAIWRLREKKYVSFGKDGRVFCATIPTLEEEEAVKKEGA